VTWRELVQCHSAEYNPARGGGKFFSDSEDINMATRSIKLKLALGKSKNEAEEARRAQLRSAVWTTHCLFNEGVAYYMNWLMLMRGEAFHKGQTEDELELIGISDGENYFFDKKQMNEEFLRRLKSQQKENGGDEENMPCSGKTRAKRFLPISTRSSSIWPERRRRRTRRKKTRKRKIGEKNHKSLLTRRLITPRTMKMKQQKMQEMKPH
jgi:hypothetical protein